MVCLISPAHENTNLAHQPCCVSGSRPRAQRRSFECRATVRDTNREAAPNSAPAPDSNRRPQVPLQPQARALLRSLLPRLFRHRRITRSSLACTAITSWMKPLAPQWIHMAQELWGTLVIQLEQLQANKHFSQLPWRECLLLFSQHHRLFSRLESFLFFLLGQGRKPDSTAVRHGILK